MRVVLVVLVMVLAGCVPQSPPMTSAAPSGREPLSQDFQGFLVEVANALVAVEPTLDQPVAEADQPLVELEKQTLGYSAGKAGDTMLPQPMKTLASSVFWQLNDARTTQQPINLEFREGHVPVIQAEGRKILVSSGALALLSSREDFAKALAFEIGLIDRGDADLRFRMPILMRDISKELAARRLPSTSNVGTLAVAARGAIALLNHRFKAADQDACALLIRASYGCNGTNTGLMVASRLAAASQTVNGQFLIQRIPVFMPPAPTEGPSAANSQSEPVWVKASEGMMVSAPFDTLAGQGLELLSRRDGVHFKLPGVEVGRPISRGLFISMVDGSRGYIVSAPPEELLSWDSFGTLVETGEMQVNPNRTVSWQAYRFGDENGFVARWSLSGRTYEIFLRGGLPVASLRSRASDLFGQMRVTLNSVMARYPEDRIVVRQVASRAEAMGLERTSARPMSFAGGWNKFLFPMLNNAETVERLPDGPQLIRYLQ